MNNNLGNKNTMAKNIKYYMKLQGKTRNDICEAIGVPYTTLTDWINAATYPRIDSIERLANYFGVSKADLVERHSFGSLLTTSNNDPSLPFPIIGEVAAGYSGLAAEEETGDYEQIPISWLRGRKPDEFFVLRVKGDSMYPRFIEGDHVLVLRTTTVDSGTIAVVLYDSDAATLKRVNYVYGEDWMELEPLNPEYAPKRIEGENLEQCRVLGEVWRLIRVVKE